MWDRLGNGFDVLLTMEGTHQPQVALHATIGREMRRFSESVFRLINRANTAVSGVTAAADEENRAVRIRAAAPCPGLKEAIPNVVRTLFHNFQKLLSHQDIRSAIAEGGGRVAARLTSRTWPEE